MNNKIESSCTWNKSSSPFEVPKEAGSCTASNDKNEEEKKEEKKKEEEKKEEEKKYEEK